MNNLMSDGEFGSFEILKFKSKRGNQIIQHSVDSVPPPLTPPPLPQEIRFSLLNLRKFQKTEKSTSESYKIVLNLLSDEEFGFFEFLQLK